MKLLVIKQLSTLEEGCNTFKYYIYLLCIYLAGSNPGEFICMFSYVIPRASNVYVFRSQLPVSSEPAPKFLYIVSMN